jgi:hypothetical protein
MLTPLASKIIKFPESFTEDTQSLPEPEPLPILTAIATVFSVKSAGMERKSNIYLAIVQKF